MGGGYLYKQLNKDVKEINKVFLSLFSVGIILIAIFIGLNITKSSYALFSDKVVSTNTIEVEVENNIPNPPVLDTHMVSVYYDEENGTWNKADETNKNLEYKWYDYNNKIWANSITYDNTIVDDLASSDNNGEISGALYQKDGMSFDGENDYVDAGYENYDFNNKITLIARFKTNSLKTGGTVLIDNYSNNNNTVNGFQFYVGETTGRVVFQFFNKEENTNVRVNVGTNERVSLNTWYTAVATYDGETMKIYLNGELQNEKALTPEEINSINSTYPIAVGASVYNGPRFAYDGTISDAIVINDCLTEEEIKTYYSEEVNYNENENTLFYYNLRGYEGRKNGSFIPMDMIKTMQVWVPRYKYKVWNYNSDGTKTSNPQEIDIIFERGAKSTGDITCTDNIQGEGGDGTSEVCKLNGNVCIDSTCNNKYYTHPAFTFGEEALTGFWVGKFELTGELDSITTKPNISSIRSQTVSSFETNIMAMNDESNIYGFSSSADTHMIKNMEWGAISYLSHSRYGICSDGVCYKIYRNNNSNYLTGCGSSAGSSETTTCNTYNTEEGMLASTTGNIYGVYDMNGGANDYVMGNVVSPDGEQMMSGYSATNNSGYTGIIYAGGNYTSYTGTYSYPEEKYYDKYSFGNSSSVLIGSKLGDSIKEVKSDSLLWYNGNYYMAHNLYPWFARGMFTQGNGGGGRGPSYSTHLIIIS